MRRLNRLFRPDGRSLMVAMDHPAFVDHVEAGLVEPGLTIAATAASGADGFLLPPGTASRSADEMGSAALIVSVAFDDPSAVETALRLDAACVKVITFPGAPGAADARGRIAALAAECHRWNMPLMVETIPGGWDAGIEARGVERLAVEARTVAELGVDLVKTFAPASADEMRYLARYAGVPVFILGGGHDGDRVAMLARMRALLDGGASGLVFGRNIWGDPDPASACAELASVVHPVALA